MTRLTVEPTGNMTVTTVVHGSYTIHCALGRAGVMDGSAKREGDGATPAGLWRLRHVFFRPDRMGWPDTRLPVAPLSNDLGWSDDPKDPANYNAMVKLPYAFSHEKLWREDDLYDLIVVLGINDGPAVPGRGSAVFFHLARSDFAPTEGCVAVTRPDMLAILKECGPESVMEVVE